MGKKNPFKIRHKWKDSMVMDCKVIGFESINWFILSRVLYKDFNENFGSMKPLDFLINWSCLFLQDSVPFSDVICIVSVSCVRLCKRLERFYLNHETIFLYIGTRALVCVGPVLAQTVSCRNVAEETRFKSQAISCGKCGEECDTGIGCGLSTSVLPCEYLPPPPPPTLIRLRITDFILS